MFCHRCGYKIEVDRKIGREELCPECKTPLHCCLNCRCYDSFSHWQCRETEIEYIQDKAAGNFCDYFKPSDKYHPPDTKREAAKKQLDNLFKKQ